MLERGFWLFGNSYRGACKQLGMIDTHRNFVEIT